MSNSTQVTPFNFGANEIRVVFDENTKEPLLLHSLLFREWDIQKSGDVGSELGCFCKCFL